MNGDGKMKPIITDWRTSYVHYILGNKENGIFGTWQRINKPLASIKDIENHHEIWDCPLVVQEGEFRYQDGEYVKVGEGIPKEPNGYYGKVVEYIRQDAEYPYVKEVDIRFQDGTNILIEAQTMYPFMVTENKEPIYTESKGTIGDKGLRIHQKMELALQLLKEVQNEILSDKLPKTENNKNIKFFVQQYGKDQFIGGIETMKAWTDNLDLENQ